MRLICPLVACCFDWLCCVGREREQEVRRWRYLSLEIMGCCDRPLPPLLHYWSLGSCLLVCPSARLHYNRVDEILIIYCHLLDVRQNYKLVAVDGDWYSRLKLPETHSQYCCFLPFYVSPLSDIKKERQPPSPDDVIVLSDNEPSSPLMNGHCFTKTDTDKLMVGKQHLNFA